MNKAREFWTTPAADPHINPTPEIARDEVLAISKTPVIDFGCGFGRLAQYFWDFQYIGVDIASHRIDEARRRNPYHRFEHIDSHFDLTKFDGAQTIIVDNVLHHVPDDEIELMVESFAKTAPFVVQAEHIGTPRTGTLTSHCRPLDVYESIFGDFGFKIGKHTHVWNPRRKVNFSVILWEQRTSAELSGRQITS